MDVYSADWVLPVDAPPIENGAVAVEDGRIAAVGVREFLLGSPRLREAFLRDQADLLRPEFWQKCQRRVAAGEIVDFFPYRESLRFCRRFPLSVPAATSRLPS